MAKKQTAFKKAEWFVDHPKRMISILIIVIIVALIVYFSWSKIKGAFKNIQLKVTKDSEIAEEIANGNLPSYPDSKYKEFANRIYTAMKGAGTDKKTIKDVFEQMHNITDVLKLVQAFGVRDGEDIHQWLDGEVHWWKPGNIKKDINAILSRKGIFYKF